MPLEQNIIQLPSIPNVSMEQAYIRQIMQEKHNIIVVWLTKDQIIRSTVSQMSKYMLMILTMHQFIFMYALSNSIISEVQAVLQHYLPEI